MNRPKDRGKLLCILGLVCLLLALVLWVYFAVHYAQYFSSASSDGMSKLMYEISLVLEILFIELVLSIGTVLSWLGFKFTHSEKLKKASKIILVISMVLFGVGILGVLYLLCF